MHIPTRAENISAVSKRLLTILNIKTPTQKQIIFMETLLTDLGRVLFKLSFTKYLTKQETACLFWITRGKNTLEIAELLDLHQSTIKTYLYRIKKKLNCKTMEQAVFEGIQCCFIQPK